MRLRDGVIVVSIEKRSWSAGVERHVVTAQLEGRSDAVVIDVPPKYDKAVTSIGELIALMLIEDE